MFDEDLEDLLGPDQPPGEIFTPSMSKVESATAWAARGIPVFLLRENGKQPAGEGWQEQATLSHETIKRLWTDPVTGWVHANNIGGATGRGLPGGGYLYAVDEDNKNGVSGAGTLLDLALDGNELPPTLTSRTPSGGFHYFFRTPEPMAGTQGVIGPGIDTRGHGNLVVLPGSTISGAPYTLHLDLPVADLPQWVLDQLSVAHRRPADGLLPVADLDEAGAVGRAIHYLEHDAEHAVEGQGGDNLTVLTVAMHLKDLGLSEAMAVEVLARHWNEYCSPPWGPDDLEKKVASAYKSGTLPPGVLSAEADFEGMSEELPASRAALPGGIIAAPVLPFDTRSIPRRRWLLGTVALCGKVSLLVAPPGVGKSTLTFDMAVAVATGRPEIAGMKVHERAKVWLYNNEDDLEELQRRLAALMQHWGLTFDDLTDEQGRPMLYMNSGMDKPLLIAKRDGDGIKIVPAPGFRDALATVKALGIRFLIVDPFVETHEANENDNKEIQKVGSLYRRIAHEGGCAVMLVHHTRKPSGAAADSYAGDMNSGRGAGSLVGVARVVLTLYSMTEKDAKKYSVAEERRNRYVRLDDAKGNMSLASGKEKWFERVSVALAVASEGAGSDDEGGAFGCTEEVGVLAPVALVASKGTSEAEALVADALAVMQGDEQPLSEIAAALQTRPMHAGKEHRTLLESLAKAVEHVAEYANKTLAIERRKGRRGDKMTRHLVVTYSHREEWEK